MNGLSRKDLRAFIGAGASMPLCGGNKLPVMIKGDSMPTISSCIMADRPWPAVDRPTNGELLFNHWNLALITNKLSLNNIGLYLSLN